MKKRIFALFCALMLAAVSACGKKPNEAGSTPPASSPVQSAPVSEPVQEPATRPAIVYLPDENAENLVATEVEVPEAEEPDLTAELAALIAALEEQGALPEGSALLSAGEGDPVALDMNKAFGDGMKSTGTTGEFLYLGALVNTVLEYTGAKAATLTVEGEPLETGHTVYDEPIGVVTP